MGGKSRKSGGVSKKLVMALKNGTYSKSSKKTNCGKKQDTTPYSRTLFELADEDED
jgi:hypothetical protein